jgi:trans-2,3-dihydro-3-hydroxyanthranilate isomerase
MPLAYLHYDVFTGEPLLGNQLAVFTDARGLDTSRMQRLAREMNFAESTFILPAEQTGTDIRMRIFTPMNEMPMAGHPTIGSTFALAHTGVIKPGSSRFVFGLNIGPIPVDLEWTGSALSFAWMTQLNPTFGSAVTDGAAVAAALGLEARDLVSALPVQEVSCGVPLLFVPLRDRATVDRAISDAAAFRRLMASLRLDLPIFLFSIDPPGSRETVYSRMFAPEFGITEDPATGGASGPLGCYLVRHGVVRGEAARRMVSLQGVAMGRASRIHISITHDGDAISLVKVGGEAVLVARGEVLV